MKVYSEQKAIEESIKYFDGDTLAATTWVNKYALRNKKGELLECTPKQMHDRMIKSILRIENNYDHPVLTEDILKEYFYNFRYVIPGGSAMSGIGNTYKFTSLSNCFVVPSPVDSYGGIFLTDQIITQLCKRRGGTGTDLSNLRPKGSLVTNDAKTSSGMVSFMERYSNTVREVGQNGRRGALMLSISIDHPDAEDFIDAKLQANKVTGANISVKITDKFMQAVKNKTTYIQRFPIDTKDEDLFTLDQKAYDKPKLDYLYQGIKEGTYYKFVDAYKLWMKIMNNAWSSAEPGVLFWDNILKESPADFYEEYKTTCTNPCLHPDTEVLMANDSTKKIKDIVPGDKIKSYNTSTGEFEITTVIWSGKTKENTKIIKLHNKLICTPDHLIYDPEKDCYVEAQNCTGLYEYRDKIHEVEGFAGSIDIDELDYTSDVYDIKLNSIHNFFANGILVHNCGEIPLCPYDSCRLIAINLYSFVENPFTSEAKFNYPKLIEVAKNTQRIMDNIIDLEISHIKDIIKKIQSDPESDFVKQVELDTWQKILDKTESGRRTGVGITAEGDMLAALGIPYSSKDAIDFCTKIHKIIATSCYGSSIELAKERGAFNDWNSKELSFKTEKTSAFIERIYNVLNEEYRTDWETTGRRNIACLTIAPTGTVSLMSRTTSGIEPLFKAWYIRRRKTSDKSKAVFTDKTGDMFEEFKVFHPKFIEWFDIKLKSGDEYIKSILTPRPIKLDISIPNSTNDILNKLTEDELQSIYLSSPWYRSTAQDINWVQKVQLQGSVQKWVDHSISCTVNMPSETTVDIVNQVYLAAYESGCKGCTIYRDGSRDGVLITDTKKSTDAKLPGLNVPRPDELPATIVRFKNGNENWIAFIGLLNEKPYECFCGKVDDDIRYLPKSVTKGKILRVATGPAVEGKVPHRYDFKYEISYGYENTLPAISYVFNNEYWNYARFISGMLRAGVPVEQVINVLNSLTNSDMGDTINTWKRGVMRALRQFVTDGVKSGNKCPKCGSDLVYQGGCQICPSCGDSRCE